ncbi:unnamed protein product, partial [Rotaria socialis]
MITESAMIFAQCVGTNLDDHIGN